MGASGETPVRAGGAAGGGAAWRTAALALCLALLAVFPFRGVGEFGFVSYDDDLYVFDNPQVAGGLTPRGVAWAFTTTTTANWHPLTWLSHMLDTELFGPGAGPRHLVNLAIHVANVVLLFLFLVRAAGSPARAAAVAALFAVHPLHVESVAWISERKDLLGAFFLILALLAYLPYARRPSPLRMAPVVLLAAASLLAKPVAVTLPFVLLLLDVWPLRRIAPAGPLPPGRALAEKAPLLALSALSSIVAVIAQRQGAALQTLHRFPPGERLANAVWSYAAYLGHALWPSGLVHFYPHRGATLGPAAVAAATILLAAISLAVWRLRRVAPPLPVGWAWYLGMLIPMIGLVQVGFQGMADRYTYLPLVGIFIALAYAAPVPRSPGWRAAAAAAFLALVAALAVAASRQADLWRDDASLFGHAIAVNPADADAHYNLGRYLLTRGDAEASLPRFRRAVELSPGRADLRYGFAGALAWAGRLDEAEEQLRAVLAIQPGSWATHFHLGEVLRVKGDAEGAARHYREALRLNPAHGPSREALESLPAYRK